MINKKDVMTRLKTVMDPELFVDIVSLGLIYDISIEQKTKDTNLIRVTMTLTTPGCPLAPIIDQMIRDALAPLGAERVELILVWEPAWTKDRMSEEAKLQLGVI